MSVTINRGLEKSTIKVYPFDIDIIDIIREFNTRHYNNVSKTFTLANEEMDSFKNKLELKGFNWKETDNKEQIESDEIKLKYENNKFIIVNAPIKNKSFYFLIKDHLVKEDKKMFFYENFLLNFIELCKKNNINVNI
jgi:hypothetical protein